jgi:hypothetical protein
MLPCRHIFTLLYNQIPVKITPTPPYVSSQTKALEKEYCYLYAFSGARFPLEISVYA